MTAIRAFILIGALALSGCAGINYAMQYDGIDPIRVQTPHDNWRIFDKPSEGRMMVTPSLGEAMAGGAESGLTLGAADGTPPKPLFQQAARAYLDKTGRQHCVITDGYLIISPQFEFTYSCGAPVARPTA